VAIYGFMIVKDEADILGQTLESLCHYGGFERILVFDNGSSDDSRAVARSFEGRGVESYALDEPFTDDLKYENVYRHAHLMRDGDWFAILDADEIYREALPGLVAAAEAEGANYIESRSAQFYFTDQEPDYGFDRDRPVELQRRFYLLNYGEPRVFRYSSDCRLNAGLVKGRDPALKVAQRQLLLHHFQFRSEEQTRRRLAVRLANHSHSRNWGHVNSANWRDYIVPSRHLHCFDGQVKTGLPPGSNLFKIRDNPAYTMANLKWLRKNGHLTPDQDEFFTAGRLTRLRRKLW
jgi:glycosyltransferase involved in cell wall biosynthesis